MAIVTKAGFAWESSPGANKLSHVSTLIVTKHCLKEFPVYRLGQDLDLCHACQTLCREAAEQHRGKEKNVFPGAQGRTCETGETCRSVCRLSHHTQGHSASHDLCESHDLCHSWEVGRNQRQPLIFKLSALWMIFKTLSQSLKIGDHQHSLLISCSD